MNTTREQNALQIVDVATQLPADEVHGFLAEACGSDRALRQYIEELLSAMNESHDCLQATTVPGFVHSLSTPKFQLNEGDFLAERYLIWESLGSGGMAEVYRALDSRLGRDVAIKILNSNSLASEQMQILFEQELQAVACLSHTNVVAIYDIGRHSSNPFAVMELVEGRSLRDLIFARIDHHRAVAIAAGIASGLAAAHERGIMHRDVKPENIMVAANDEPKLVDFGIADRETRRSTVTSGVVPGTVPYMSPEQAAGVPLTCQTDMFSFGSVLYEMLTGINPFRDKTIAETLNNVADAEPQHILDVQPNCPHAIAEFAMSLLHIDPQSRPTASAATRRLKNLLSV